MKFARDGYLLLLLVLSYSVLLSAQERSKYQVTKHTFTSSDGAFFFEYSGPLIACERNPNQPDHWLPDSCEASTPICSNYSCDSAGTAACIAYRADSMKGTSFQAAAFSVSELKKPTSEMECLKVEEPPPHVGNARKETVNGVSFAVIETDGVRTGNLIDGYVYRNFHRGKCYELDIRIAYSNPAYADPGTMKDFDLKTVHQRLKGVLDTFEFVR